VGDVAAELRKSKRPNVPCASAVSVNFWKAWLQKSPHQGPRAPVF